MRATCLSKPRRVHPRPALPFAGGTLAWPIRRKPVRRYSRGAKPRAAGMGLAPIPWRQAKRAAPHGAKA